MIIILNKTNQIMKIDIKKREVIYSINITKQKTTYTKQKPWANKIL